MWLEYHNILFLLDTLVLRCPAGESLVGYRLSLYPLSPQLHSSASIRMHWFRSGSGVWQHLNWNIFIHQILASYLKQCESFLMIPLLTLFKQKLFQHQQPTNLIWLSEQHHQDIKDALIMFISGIKAHFCNWCPSSLFLKDFVHTNFVNIWSGLQRSYKMSQSYVLSNIQTFTWE